MKNFVLGRNPWVVPATAALAAVALLSWWFLGGTNKPLQVRVPGTDKAPESEGGQGANPVLTGKLIPGAAPTSPLPGDWPQFRGTNFDSVSRETTPLARSWAAGEPRELWSVNLGEGYAGPAVRDGRIYLMDYDQEKRLDALRCLSLADGSEIWRYTYPVRVKRNHGMSRTIPALSDKVVVAIGPKCHVVCLDSTTGQLKWGIDLVQEYGATVPQWYAGQCPFIENDTVILAPGGPEALLLGVEAATGKPRWRTPNPHGWNMTHSSVTPMDLDGERSYVYSADKGVVGVSARDGSLLWETTEWKISIATVASPIALGQGMVFFSGGYNAGSLMMRIHKENGAYVASKAFKLAPEVFGATQQTPILYQDHIYGVRPDGRFVCLTLEGKIAWTSDSSHQFGLGSFTLGDGLIYAINDSGLLRLIAANPTSYQLLGQAQVLKGRECWGPMALVGGRLLARDLTRMVCLQAGK